jgi:hypothetical protein
MTIIAEFEDGWLLMSSGLMAYHGCVWLYCPEDCCFYAVPPTGFDF